MEDAIFESNDPSLLSEIRISAGKWETYLLRKDVASGSLTVVSKDEKELTNRSELATLTLKHTEMRVCLRMGTNGLSNQKELFINDIAKGEVKNTF